MSVLVPHKEVEYFANFFDKDRNDSRPKFTPEKIEIMIRCAIKGYTHIMIMREMGISSATFYQWKREGLGIPAEFKTQVLEAFDYMELLRRAYHDTVALTAAERSPNSFNTAQHVVNYKRMFKSDCDDLPLKIKEKLKELNEKGVLWAALELLTEGEITSRQYEMITRGVKNHVEALNSIHLQPIVEDLEAQLNKLKEEVQHGSTIGRRTQ